ncbi:hypothetical protein EAF00_002633 [Botryotinia globosa]|nr:hypothetical protein EAF00_002633 [Botryotinia globosa]
MHTMAHLPQTRTNKYSIRFQEQKILESRLSSAPSKYSRRELYDFEIRELDAPPQIWERCPDTDNGEAMVTKRVKEFGVVRESIGMRRLGREFGEGVRRQEILVDELFLPPLFLLWLESLNLKAPKTKKSKSQPKESNPKSQPQTPPPPETPLSSNPNPNFKIHLQVTKPPPSSSQEFWIWHETLTLLKLANHSGPNKSVPTSPPASIDRTFPIAGKNTRSISINPPSHACGGGGNITILEDGVLLREYEDLYERSKEKGGPQFALSTFLAQIFHTINTSIPPSKKRGNKTNPPNNDNHPIDISELYERGR